MGEEVVVQLPEHVERNSAVGGEDVVVGLAEHVVKLVESKMLGEQLVGEAVHSGQAVQFYYSCYVASLKPGNMSMAMRIRIVTGGFFNWASPEFAKCWPVSN